MKIRYMADRFTPTQRSRLMSGIKSKGTRFELDFIELLKKTTRKKFDVCAKDIFGTPDIVFKKSKVCIFLDSDFWHGWRYSTWKTTLKDDFWRNKIEKNRIRDRKVSRRLRKEGWIVFRVWEHQIKKDPKKVLFTVLRILG